MGIEYAPLSYSRYWKFVRIIISEENNKEVLKRKYYFTRIYTIFLRFEKYYYI